MLQNHQTAFRAVDNLGLKQLLSSQPLRLENRVGVERLDVAKTRRPAVIEVPEPSVMVCSADGRILSVSAEFETATGYTLAETLGRNPRFLQGPGTSPGALAQFRALLASRKGGTVTILNYTKSGAGFFHDVELTPIFDRQGKFACFTALQTVS